MRLNYQLKNTFTTFVDNALKTLASLMISIGWLLTSDSSKTFIKDHPCIKHGAIITVIFIYVIHAFVNFGLYQRSKIIYMETQTKLFSEASEKVISTSLITLPHLISIQLMNGIVTAFLIMIIVLI